MNDLGTFLSPVRVRQQRFEYATGLTHRAYSKSRLMLSRL
jgi:hypothetical protein